MENKRNESGLPLVTMAIACYNQQWCIAEAIEGAFAQTYSPLEIVIADDCSTDSTWEIVQRMTDEYRRNGGRHKVTLHRFARNTYTAPEEEKPKFRAELHALWKGELIVQADGDDISMPDRVEKIVAIWLREGEKADLLMSGSYRIDRGSRIIGKKSCYDHPSGSAMAYTNRMENFYGLWTTPQIYGDEVRYGRAQMLGGVKLIDDELVKYRVCGGVSQVLDDFRVPMVRQYVCLQNSRLQLLKDVETARSVLPEAEYLRWKQMFKREYDAYDAELPLWESGRMVQRLRAYFTMPLKRMFLSGMLVYGPLLLLPRWLGDPVLNLIHRIAVKVHLKIGQ